MIPLPPPYPDDLPILAKKAEILNAVRRHPVVIVSGETGSGKTTQLPKICLEAGRGQSGMIGCTQPRRVAALAVSRRIAEELGVTWGREVGCKIRFTDETGPETRIKMMTDGILLAEIQSDPDLRAYDTLIVDEAHERSLNVDFLLGYLRLLRARRPDLKVIITSATIDVETFSKAFDAAPVVEVSGRLYPVEVRYWPLEDLGRGAEDYTYIEAALQAVDALMEESPAGDMLVFMPTEKDIHETRRRLEGRAYRHTDVLPLFGRLTAADQQRVFMPGRNRRIVVATNVAETSLTIPNIRYVIDTGLARLSRYNPRTQTHRLPIEPVAQSSAQQRAGRCGRVMHGVCIRLYSEADLRSRPAYTQPEIQRANLAEVILRMLALRLGEVHTFPFLDPPRPQAIQGGFQLLEELGAVDAGRRLTSRGRAMARLPIAPTVSRMVLQAQEESALREVLVIAAAISIQDPRVRPLDQQQKADQEHRKFVHPESDFLTLLNIWTAYHDTFEHLQTQAAMRRFCREHFLAYHRMREWRDIYEQLRRTLREIGGFRTTPEAASYDAVHRSVLAGLLSNIAEKKEGNLYRAGRGREVMLFPGSGLFRRKPEKNHRAGAPADGAAGQSAAPPWIVAAEIVETGRLYARTVARIQQGWLPDLGRHLCQPSYTHPSWDRAAGRVLVTETLTLYGLRVRERRIGYHRVNPAEATEIFIREALAGDNLGAAYPFLDHNRRVRQDVETWMLQHREGTWIDLDEAAERFYAGKLAGVSSIHDLNRFLKAQGDPAYLYMRPSDLTGGQAAAVDPADFPEYLDIEGERLPLAYACRPGRPEDGVTVTLPYKLVHFVSPETLEWLVPGLRAEKIGALLRALPQRLRKRLVPIPETAARIAGTLEPTYESLQAALAAHLKRHYGLDIDPADWRADTVPDHLRMRVRVTGPDGQPLFEGRDLEALKGTVAAQTRPRESAAWERAAEQWAQYDLRGWTCGDLPERVEVSRAGALPVYGYPGLQADGGMVHVRLFRDADEAARETRRGLGRLGEMALAEELAWLRRDLRALRNLPDLAAHAGGAEAFQEAAYEHLKAALFTREPLHPLTGARFAQDVEEARQLLKGLGRWFLDQMRCIAGAFREIRQVRTPYPGMKTDLARLLPPDFLARTPAVRLPHLVRYLKAVAVRAERARVDTAKDQRKAEQVRPFEEALEALARRPSADPRLVEAYRWMLEEYRVSVFAQELGTPEPVSPKRLEEKLAAIG
jgi:ATP-dependent helicase HrpA